MADIISNTDLALALLGLASGFMLGLAARLGRFCSLGAIEDILYGGRYSRALMWPSAIGAAMIGIGLIAYFEAFRLEEALYLRFTPNFGGHIIGGLIFGYGMALAGMCGFTALARMGTGDMRALVVVLVIGIFSYIAASGLLAPLRDRFFAFTPIDGTLGPPSYSILFAKWFALSPGMVLIIFGVVLSLLPLLRTSFRRSRFPLWGIIVGIAIALTYWGSYAIFEENLGASNVEAHSFSQPIGDSLVYIMLASGTRLSLGVGSVAGVVLGGLAGAMIKREFSWEACDDARELRRHLFGAALMGTGALLAFGCSIGQGLSAMAVMSYGAPISLLFLSIGAWIGLKYLVEG